MTTSYRLEAGATLARGSRGVVRFGDGVGFMCPCGNRQVFVTSKIHGISFNEEGLLTLNPSCGYHENSEHPQNWCHFWLKDGEATMVSDSKCPGAVL